MTDAVQRRVLRRELHSPRTAAMVGAAVVVLAGCAYLGTEIVLALLGAPALLASPQRLTEEVAALSDAPPGVVGTVGGLVVLLGLVLLLVAVTPGRRPRRALAAARSVVVADDVVIASALARVAARAASLHPDRVTVAVSRRSATARIVPLSGVPVDVAAITAAMQAELDRDRLDPPLRAAVRIAPSGRVGG